LQGIERNINQFVHSKFNVEQFAWAKNLNFTPAGTAISILNIGGQTFIMICCSVLGVLDFSVRYILRYGF